MGTYMDRDEAIRRIRAGLRERTGRRWSVTGGRGTAWGWLTIDTPPAERTWRWRLPAGLPDEPDNYEVYDSSQVGGHMSPAAREELAQALGLRSVGWQGESIPSSSDHYREYVDRAEGREPSVIGRPYWD